MYTTYSTYPIYTTYPIHMLRTILLYSFITAIATGLGALPFAFKKNFTTRQQALAHAIAAALMITASFGMIYEGVDFTHNGLDEIVAGVGLATW